MRMTQMMIELSYRTKGSVGKAWTEIEAGNEVVLKVTGWRKKAVYRVFKLYVLYLELSQKGRAPISLGVRIAWQSLLAPSIIGLCEHARRSGLTTSMEGDGNLLEVRFKRRQESSTIK